VVNLNSNDFIIEMLKINKTFSGVKVLSDVDLNLVKGEIHGLVGQNGAGKSTLIKILNGVYTSDSGKIIINGKLIDDNKNHLDPKQYAISTVFQEFSLIPSLTVGENVFLGIEPTKGFLTNDKYIERETKKILNELKMSEDIDLKEKIKNLGISYCQIVEIVKSLAQKGEILILDEPTAALSYKETELLFEVMKRLKNKGISIIFISHYLDDIFKVCDRITVLRDGRNVFTDYVKNTKRNDVIKALVGCNTNTYENNYFQRKKIDKSSNPLLEIKYLKNDTANKLKDIKLNVYKGEIVGVAGLLGSGKTEMLNSIYGFDKKCDKLLKLDGKKIKINSISDARKNGIALIPEDRNKQGLILNFSIRDNILLSILNKLVNFLFFINDPNGNKIVNNLVQKLKIKLENIDQKIKYLSGGNQQKVIIAKTIITNPRVLLLDDPTTGIDIKSKEDIFKTIYDFTQAGNGVILVSSELSELIKYCTRILILKQGSIKDEIDCSGIEKNINEEELLELI